jgi:ribose/xylose/arabinose/galactoside ABC-type transport system permease subunit
MAGFFDLSLESTYAIAPIVGVLVIRLAPDFPGIVYIGIVMVMIIGIVVGLINGILSVKLGINPFLVTLCMMLILRGLSLYLIPEGIFNLPKPFIFLGSYRILNNKLPISVPCFIILIIILNWMLRNKPFGRHLLAVGSNERAAYLVGIKTDRIKITVFVIAGMLAALGGFIAAGRQNAVLNAMGSGSMVLMFAGAVLGGISLSGGVGSIIGILGGVLLLQIVSNLITLSKVNPFLVQVVYGSILLLALLLQSLRSKIKSIY